jgi:hypothetical protein
MKIRQFTTNARKVQQHLDARVFNSPLDQNLIKMLATRACAELFPFLLNSQGELRERAVKVPKNKPPTETVAQRTPRRSDICCPLLGSFPTSHLVRTHSQIDTTINKVYNLNLHNDTLCTNVPSVAKIGFVFKFCFFMDSRRRFVQGVMKTPAFQGQSTIATRAGRLWLFPPTADRYLAGSSNTPRAMEGF